MGIFILCSNPSFPYSRMTLMTEKILIDTDAPYESCVKIIQFESGGTNNLLSL